MKEIYLTRELKVYYNNDFIQNVLTCKDRFWRLDEGLKNILIQINSNPKVHTLYSKRHQLNNFSNSNSYIKFAYAQDIETKLETVLSEIENKYCSTDEYDEQSCIYSFLLPEENSNFIEGENCAFDLACLIDKDYFKIKHISINLESNSLKVHDAFWNDITKELSTIK